MLGAAFAALSKAARGESFRKIITDLVGEGGDADTNCAIAAAMIGAFQGVSAIPDSWKQLRDEGLVREMAAHFVS